MPLPNLQTYFVSGIDTDCGKTIATGLIAKFFLDQGLKTITQKLIQSGCDGFSEDILTHRKMMQSPLLLEDETGLTCPYTFKYPSSPHLAAAVENVEIDIEKIIESTQKLQKAFEILLIEGAGGLFVPIKSGYMIIDHLLKINCPLILVTSSKVGSINHTLMSLMLCKQYNVKLQALIFNHFPNPDKLIVDDSKLIFENYLRQYFPEADFYEIPDLTTNVPSAIFNFKIPKKRHTDISQDQHKPVI